MFLFYTNLEVYTIFEKDSQKSLKIFTPFAVGAIFTNRSTPPIGKAHE